MTFTIKTAQCNGTIPDTIEFLTYADLLDDLEAIDQIPSIKIIWIKKDGQDMDIDNCLMDLSVDEFRDRSEEPAFVPTRDKMITR